MRRHVLLLGNNEFKETRTEQPNRVGFFNSGLAFGNEEVLLRMRTSWRLWYALLAAVLILPLVVFGTGATTTRAEDAPANAAFKAIVERTDLPVALGSAKRSWLWGPGGFKTDQGEPYADSPGGKRLVQYYDKARLEINNPTSGGVTSGLLAKELMTGQLQQGDTKFETRGPSSISVAGDIDDVLSPSYADLGLLFDRPAFTVSTVITTFIRPDGTQAGLSSLSQYNVTAVEYAAGSKHTIANVFKDFLNSSGPVFVNNATTQAKIFDSSLFTTGLPLTEPYWTRAKIGGKVQDVLVQGFERRVMTYTPGNPEGFKVETGNVGRHYVEWRFNTQEFQLLGINDFHGRLLPEVSGGVARGGAAYIAPVINKLRDSNPNTLLIGAGDGVGATQLQSALLQDEPSITVFNKLKFDVSSVGNHEFDKGLTEAYRITRGGKNPVRGNDWAGANYPYVVANLEDKQTGKPPFDPYVILNRGGVKVAVIGAVTKDLPTLVSPTGIASLNVLDEATAVNKYIPEVKQKGAQIIVVAIHEGGTPTLADGQEKVTGRIVDIAAALDPAVDVVISGHTHQEYVAYMSGKLVTQSGFYTRNVTSLRLRLDPTTKKIVSKRAVNVPVINSLIKPDPEIDAVVQQAVKDVAPVANQKISTTATEITRDITPGGETPMGNLIADAQRDALKTDFSFMNPGGVRANQPAGDITYGSLFTIQPFGNILVKIDMTGDQIYRLLEQQWKDPNRIRILHISGLSYTWDNAKPFNSKIVEVRGGDGKPLDKNKIYSAVTNNFLQAGGDGFTVFTEIKTVIGGPIDIDAFIDYIKKQPQPLVVKAPGDRITRLN